MKLYRRAATPNPGFKVIMVKEWDLLSFGNWQDFLAEAGAPVVSIGEYNLESTRDHLLAIDNSTIIGTLQVADDDQGRTHLHRLVVHPDRRNTGVAQELVRQADFHYDDTELWAFAEDDNPLPALLDLYMFEEVTDADQPEAFEVGGAGERVRDGDQGPAGAPGGSGGEQPPVDSSDAPGEDQQAAGGVRPEDVGTDRQDLRRRVRKRGKRGGRKRK
jgi:predicted GNAT family N-acyltransferase